MPGILLAFLGVDVGRKSWGNCRLAPEWRRGALCGPIQVKYWGLVDETRLYFVFRIEALVALEATFPLPQILWGVLVS